MSDIAIRVENLGKMYRIGRAQERHDTLRDALVAAVRTPLERLRRDGRGRDGGKRTIWALKDVSFEVRHGEVMGVIGRNGAGKTTLLKVLSRITEPTEGWAEIHGRVGSLLEVGTGFHPELTGRDNVYLNGAILGMRRTEIDRRFDEIVAFSEMERFIDTPVKHYSSGMYVRLAFAVAAHLEPEVLLVDEVLAVGDVAFRRKCVGKMGAVAKQGRTVLFVSHNMSAVNELCSRAVLLEGGTVVCQGQSRATVDRYLASASERTLVPIRNRRDRMGSGRLRFSGVRLLVDGQEVSCVENGQCVTIEASYQASETIYPQHVRFAVSVSSMKGIKVASFDSYASQFTVDRLPAQGVLRCHIPGFPLIQGRYRGLLYAEINGEEADRLPDAFEFNVISGRHPAVGFFSVQHHWSLG